jgi:hypothetical protein
MLTTWGCWWVINKVTAYGISEHSELKSFSPRTVKNFLRKNNFLYTKQIAGALGAAERRENLSIARESQIAEVDPEDVDNILFEYIDAKQSGTLTDKDNMNYNFLLACGYLKLWQRFEEGTYPYVEDASLVYYKKAKLHIANVDEQWLCDFESIKEIIKQLRNSDLKIIYDYKIDMKRAELLCELVADIYDKIKGTNYTEELIRERISGYFLEHKADFQQDPASQPGFLSWIANFLVPKREPVVDWQYQ